jgi:hypothetical protein
LFAAKRLAATANALHIAETDEVVLKHPCVLQLVGSPASEQSAHHAAYQTAGATTTAAVMTGATPAATTGQMLVIGIVVAAGTGVRRRDDFDH